MREAAARADTRGHIEADVAFHYTIVAASGNYLLNQFWQAMRLATTTFLTVSKVRRSLRELAERHVPVIAALRSHDPALAEVAVRRHIEEPGEWILAAEEQVKQSNQASREATAGERS